MQTRKKDLFNIEKLRKTVLTVRALDHPLRQQVLDFIRDNNGCNVTEIIKFINRGQSVVSQHLSILRKAGIVTCLRKGQAQHYFINKDRLDKLNKALSYLEPNL